MNLYNNRIPVPLMEYEQLSRLREIPISELQVYDYPTKSWVPVTSVVVVPAYCRRFNDIERELLYNRPMAVVRQKAPEGLLGIPSVVFTVERCATDIALHIRGVTQPLRLPLSMFDQSWKDLPVGTRLPGN